MIILKKCWKVIAEISKRLKKKTILPRTMEITDSIISNDPFEDFPSMIAYDLLKNSQ